MIAQKYDFFFPFPIYDTLPCPFEDRLSLILELSVGSGAILVTTTLAVSSDISEELEDNEYVQLSAGFGCPFPFGKFADPLNCGRYYQCTCATPHSHQCPEKTMYDERKEECLDENLVRCGHRPGGIEIDDDFEELKERKNLRCPCSFGTFVHPDDCSKYMICIHDVPTVYTCKKNQLFHAQHKKCFPAEEVTCDPRINPDNLRPPVKKTTTTTTTTTTPAPTTTTTTPVPTTTTPEPTTTTPEPTTTTPEPTTTEPTTTQAPVTTPGGKVTKPNTPPPHDCDEDDLDCIIDVTGDPKGWFDCPDRFGYFPHAGSEKLFIHCDNWRPFVKKCNLQEKFSPKMLVCVWIGNPGDHVEK
ncbi:unnamed protein product [Larinioides sclopetarius]|uniref:Chitin-binding type-2 domain-containing protein n=1 Tax=Larinioides sclopetarius TaxID=280406 RepID=A0AAV2AWB4_9ARAC